MWEKLKNDKKTMDVMIKLIAVVIIAAIVILSFDVLTNSRDGRRQIIDQNGGTEAALCTILEDIKGVGEVDVMITYDNSRITGVIVTAEGAGRVVVRNNITNAVSGLFNIPVKNVMVFEKENGGAINEQNQ